ncbi:MAG: hypothetical protein P1V97_17680 [Planctomycetota bacterium]|nr:hypothetical protein [Planctomycetota bacterium]
MRKTSTIILLLYLFTQPCCSQDSDNGGTSPASKPNSKKPVAKTDDEKTIKYIKDWHLRDDLAAEGFSAIGSAYAASPRGIMAAREFASTAARAKLFTLQNTRTDEVVKRWISKCPKVEQTDLTKLFTGLAFQKHLKDQPLHGSLIVRIHFEKKKVYALAQSPAKIYFEKAQLSLEKFIKDQKKTVSKASWDELKKLTEELEMAWSTKQRVYLLRASKPAKKKK